MELINKNLDYLCAKYGQEIPVEIPKDVKMKDVENLIRNSLGVLQEEGLFAFVIFLQSKKNKISNKILDQCDTIIKKAEIPDVPDENVREKILRITKDLDKMFLTKDIIERCLTYGIYRARALTPKSD